MSLTTDIIQYRMPRDARPYDAERVALARARLNGGSYDNCPSIIGASVTPELLKALDEVKPDEPLVLIGQGDDQCDGSDAVAFAGLIFGMFIVAFVIALTWGL